MSAKSWLLVKHALSWYFQSCWESVKPGLNSREKAFDVLCFPDFPGLKSDRGFRAEFKIETVRDIPLEKFRMSVKPLKAYEKLKGVVELVDKQLEMMKAAEPVPDVVLIVLPKPVEDGCATIGASFMRKRTSLFEKMMRSLLKESAAQKPQQFVGPRLCGTGGRAVASILERSPCYQSSRDEARSTHANRLGKNSAGQKRHTRSGHHGVAFFYCNLSKS
jgi:hypothetical protein